MRLHLSDSAVDIHDAGACQKLFSHLIGCLKPPPSGDGGYEVRASIGELAVLDFLPQDNHSSEDSKWYAAAV